VTSEKETTCSDWLELCWMCTCIMLAVVLGLYCYNSMLYVPYELSSFRMLLQAFGEQLAFA
jgi:hypothetical protein